MVQIDAHELRDFGKKLETRSERCRKLAYKAIKRGANDTKKAIQADLATSSYPEFRNIRIGYEMHDDNGNPEADIAPYKGGIHGRGSSHAAIAFFGGAHGGGGTHKFYEHGIEQLPATAHYVALAAEGRN